MAAPLSETSQPGSQVGPTSEFSLFFRVKPGEGASAASALGELQDTPGYRPGDYGMAVSTIHEARFVLFDDDTRLVVHHELRRPVGRLHGGLLHLGADARALRRHLPTREGYDGLPDLAALKAFILSAQQTAAAYARNYGGTVKEIRKAQRVNAAFQQVLDHPDAGRGAAAPGARAAARRGRGLGRRRGAEQRHVRPHLRAAGAGRSDRRHHRRVRVPEPGAAGPPRARHEHAAVRAAVRRALGRADLPLPAAAADRRERAGTAVPRPRTPARSSSTACSRHRTSANGAGRAGGHVHDLVRRRDRLVPRQRRARRARGTASGSSPARAGIRSSWTRRPR